MDVMARPDRATFRLPAAALFLPVLLFLCATPLATGTVVGSETATADSASVADTMWTLVLGR